KLTNPTTPRDITPGRPLSAAEMGTLTDVGQRIFNRWFGSGEPLQPHEKQEIVQDAERIYQGHQANYRTNVLEPLRTRAAQWPGSVPGQVVPDVSLFGGTVTRQQLQAIATRRGISYDEARREAENAYFKVQD